MPSIQVTSVSTGADTLTAVAHGLLTGDRFVLRNSGGALPAATPALASVTTYFAVRVDNDTIKIAETSAAALAGTPVVNITGAGTGTHFVEHSLPYCENRVAANLTQVFPEDDNEAWDALKAIYRLLTAQTQSIWSTIVIALTTTFNALVTFAAGATASANQHITVSGTGRFKHGTIELDVAMLPPAQYNSGSFGTPGNPPIGSAIIGTGATSGFVSYFTLPVGKRVVNVNAVVQESTSGGTDKAHVSLFRVSNAAAFTLIGTGTASLGNNTVQTILFNANHTVLTVTTYAAVVNFALGSAAINIHRMWVDFDEP